jgi:subtilisin family serine protease
MQKSLINRNWFPATFILGLGLAIFTHAQAQVNLPASYPVRPLEDIYKKIPDSAYAKHTVSIAIIDDGIDYNHPSLAYKISRTEPGWDFEDGDGEPYDQGESHGTHVAGIAASHSELIRIIGIRKVKVFDVFNNSAAIKSVAEGIDYAAQRGAKIVNMSLGTPHGDWSSVAERMRSHSEILFVVASGNEGLNLNQEKMYPASLNYRPAPDSLKPIPNLLVVGSNTGKNWTSNWGNRTVDILADGDKVKSAINGGGTAKFSGTSMSAPRVANIAARILLERPDLKTAEVISILENSADIDADPAYVRDGRILNAARALKMAKKFR